MADTDKLDKVTVTRVHVQNEEGEKAIGKKKGTYVTLEIPEIVHKEQETLKNYFSAGRRNKPACKP